ncbi:MAG: hypothetical protein Kow0080_04740 [Candidatus Promineifilaceae bacterium]
MGRMNRIRMQIASRFDKNHILPTAAILIVTAVWLWSMPTTIAIANAPLPDPTGAFNGILQLMDDSGEFVIAWHTWGVTHAPGYPLLGLVANLGTRLLDPLRLYPAAAAHLLSFFFAMGAFWLLTRPFSRLEPSGAAVAAVWLLPAFGILVWLYAVVAEAYAFGLLLAAAVLYTALQLGESPSTHRLYLLGLLFGLAVGHHRTLLFLGPALLLAAWPARRLGWRHWLAAATLAAMSLLVYLYLPVVAWAGSPWVYGRSPTTWAGFTDALLAREYSARLMPPTTLPEIAGALYGRLQYLAQEMSTAGLAVGIAGFIPAFIHPATRRLAAVLLLAFCGYWLAPVSQGLLIRSYMMILAASLILAAAWGAGLTALGKLRPWLPMVGLLITAAIAANNFRTHQPYIWFHTKDQSGTQMIADAAQLPGDHPVVGEVWGPRFFPLAFGKLVTGELAHIRLYDLRGDLGGLPSPPPDVINVNEETLYAIPLPQWEQRYGTAVSLSSQGKQMVAVRKQPEIAPIMTTPLAATAELQLLSASAELTADNNLFIKLQWQATSSPTQDYSVFIHVSDKAQIASADDIFAQGDRAHPVAGFYPTTHWQTGELVQDNYLIPLPAGKTPQLAAIGLYTVSPDGQFTNYLRYEMPIFAND